LSLIRSGDYRYTKNDIRTIQSKTSKMERLPEDVNPIIYKKVHELYMQELIPEINKRVQSIYMRRLEKAFCNDLYEKVRILVNEFETDWEEHLDTFGHVLNPQTYDIALQNMETSKQNIRKMIMFLNEIGKIFTKKEFMSVRFKLHKLYIPLCNTDDVPDEVCIIMSYLFKDVQFEYDEDDDEDWLYFYR